MSTVTTKQGDMVDAIAFDVYGTSQTTTEAILAANPQLEPYGAQLPEGLVITLPDVDAPPPAETIMLWD